jgi:hypothetical protein
VAAEDNLSEQLFHGTGASLKPGEIIEDRGDGAWATTSSGLASRHAKMNLSTPKHLIYEPGGTNQHIKNWQMPMFNPVYKVEPVDKGEMESTSKERGVPSDTRVSKKGFRVTGVHKWESVPLDR